MSVRAIIQRRQQALINAWRDDPLIMVQAESTSALPGLVFLDDRGSGASVGQPGRIGPSNAAIVQRPGNPDISASVWVRASYTGYQSAYLAFLKSAYGVSATRADLAGYNIDHLLNRARSPGGAGFIRVEAISEGANQAWGRLFEKAASNPQFYANQNRLRRTMSWTICAKLADLSPPTGPDDKLGIDRLVGFFTSKGLSEEEARDGLTSMLQFAYGLR